MSHTRVDEVTGQDGARPTQLSTTDWQVRHRFLTRRPADLGDTTSHRD